MLSDRNNCAKYTLTFSLLNRLSIVGQAIQSTITGKHKTIMNTQPDNQTPDQQEQDYIRLCNSYSLIRELFPDISDRAALLAAGGIIRALYKKTD